MCGPVLDGGGRGRGVNVCFQGQSGKHILALSFSVFDPSATLASWSATRYTHAVAVRGTTEPFEQYLRQG